MDWTIEQGKLALERMQQRASCRNFSDREIPEDILKSILETGTRAASGGNLQPYSIVVVRDKEKRAKLAELNMDQEFMAKAPVNLVFLLDWYKNGRLAKIQKAPYTAHESYMHFIIGIEDVMCAAQTIETAAWLMGIGSVYIGTSNYAGKALAELLDLPEHTYPVVILSMGYPKRELKVRDKLPYEITVFDESYPPLSDAEIENAFLKKYGTLERELSKVPAVREEILTTLKQALLTTYSPEETQAILDDIQARNKYGEYHYRFGLHYHAAEVLEIGMNVLEQMKEQQLVPFQGQEK